MDGVRQPSRLTYARYGLVSRQNQTDPKQYETGVVVVSMYACRLSGLRLSARWIAEGRRQKGPLLHITFERAPSFVVHVYGASCANELQAIFRD